jgi:hypothetical protein
MSTGINLLKSLRNKAGRFCTRLWAGSEGRWSKRDRLWLNLGRCQPKQGDFVSQLLKQPAPDASVSLIPSYELLQDKAANPARPRAGSPGCHPKTRIRPTRQRVSEKGGSTLSLSTNHPIALFRRAKKWPETSRLSRVSSTATAVRPSFLSLSHPNPCVSHRARPRTDRTARPRNLLHRLAPHPRPKHRTL